MHLSVSMVTLVSRLKEESGECFSQLMYTLGLNGERPQQLQM